MFKAFLVAATCSAVTSPDNSLDMSAIRPKSGCCLDGDYSRVLIGEYGLKIDNGYLGCYLHVMFSPKRTFLLSVVDDVANTE